ncbi:MAG TPA: FAD:protein FMN transferase [Streptosporangiaceae bacterium]|nr:FAD:protein FMN transferase [Streptosporangiaceae bacterium]
MNPDSVPAAHQAGPGPAARQAARAAISLGRPAVPAVSGWTGKALGTFCSVLVTRPAALDAARATLSSELATIDLACSRFRPDSELSRLNRASGKPVSVSALFAQALRVALRAAEITAGDVDPTCGRSLVSLGYDRDYAELAADTSALTLPPAPAAGWRCVEFDSQRRIVRVPGDVMLDFGATAKALASDLAADAIARQLGCGVLVNLGGDIAVSGQAPDGGWRVGVDDGVTGAGQAGPGGSHLEASGRGKAPVVCIEGGGLATSSPSVRGWRRGDRELHHIVLPSTGQPAQVYWAAVSVAAASCVDANTASTASIIRGALAPAWLESLRLPARLVRPDNVLLTTGGWPR